MNYLTIATLTTLTLTLPTSGSETEREVFGQQLSRNWQETFRDNCLGKWADDWFLDGINAKVTNSDKGMRIDAAKGYAVLWTQREFEGDLKIEYDFQRLDANDKGVNIIYIQVRGKGTEGFDLDITQWAEKRKLAAMRNYFNNMDTYHISYAAFPEDYVRGRRYMPLTGKGLKGTELDGTIREAGLFKTNEWLHVTIVKLERELLVEFKGKDHARLCRLVNTDKPGISIGRIGLRLMPGRESRFKNFSVSTVEPAEEPSLQAPSRFNASPTPMFPTRKPSERQ